MVFLTDSQLLRLLRLIGNNLQLSQTILSADQIATMIRIGCFPVEIQHQKRKSDLELQASKGVSCLHGGVFATLCHKTIVAQIADFTHPIGQPADTQTITDAQVVGTDCPTDKKFGLTTSVAAQILAECLPAGMSGISGQHIKRTQRCGSITARRVVPYPFERALRNMLAQELSDRLGQGHEITMHGEPFAEPFLDMLSQGKNLRLTAGDAHWKGFIFHKNKLYL